MQLKHLFIIALFISWLEASNCVQAEQVSAICVCPQDPDTCNGSGCGYLYEYAYRCDGGFRANDYCQLESDCPDPIQPAVLDLDSKYSFYSKGDGAIKLDNNGSSTVTGNDLSLSHSPNFENGKLRVWFERGVVASEDLLSFDTSGIVSLSSTQALSEVMVNATVVGTLENNISIANELIVNLNANATPEMLQTLIRAVTYENLSSPTPSKGVRTIALTIEDGDGGGVSDTNNVLIIVTDEQKKCTPIIIF